MRRLGISSYKMITFYMYNTNYRMQKTVEGNGFYSVLVLLLTLHQHNNVELKRLLFGLMMKLVGT